MMRRLQTFLLAPLAALLAVQAAFSLRWLIAHDEAPLLYEAFLMQKGFMPYRDIFDFQMPGSFLAYYLLGALSAFGPFRLRILDLAILAALLAVTFLFMRRFGKIPAAAAAILFGLKYMQGGAFMSLQREYLFLPFIAVALWINLRDDLPPRDYFITGFLFGLAAIIKPHAALGLIPIALFHVSNLGKRATRNLLLIAFGFSIPIILVGAWLAWTGALSPFVDIALNYWRLYSQINGQMEITPAETRLPFLLTQTIKLGGHALWLLPASIGVYLVPQENKKRAYLLAALALCYAVYPALSGQFFEYHYIPFIYFIVLLSSLALTPLRPSPHAPRSSSFIFHLSSFILCFTILVAVRPSNTFIRQIEGRPIAKTTDRAAVIAKYLEANLQAGDTVQPLDWTGGTLLAMLETRAPIATSYVFDFYFYHHVSTPYIQNLRADFMRQLQKANPRFIVEVAAVDKPWVSGEDTTREFPELRGFLNQNYSVEVDKGDYLIYKRR
ncbi:MAG: hypothetical protein PHQ36_00210 [Anaerolineales bacterium]|nr:hypothetical protein [Anaerolineales bacterium]